MKLTFFGAARSVTGSCHCVECGGKRILIDIRNPVLLEMLRSNEYTKTGIRQAIAAVTGHAYPIGPYRTAEAEAPKADPLEALIASLPTDESIHIH